MGTHVHKSPARQARAKSAALLLWFTLSAAGVQAQVHAVKDVQEKGGSQRHAAIEAPEGASVGICIRTVAGDKLLESNASVNFIPASNLKVVTAGTALKNLGKDFRFRTSLAYSGRIDADGVLTGDLYIIGGGDPTLGSGLRDAFPADSLFCSWEYEVRRAGIREIRGSVIGDSRRMPAQVNGSWMYEDLCTYYGTACRALMFNGNRLDMVIAPGSAEGLPVKTGGNTGRGCGNADDTVVPENRPWMKIENACTTGAPGSGDRTYLQVSGFAPSGRLVGTYAADRKARKISYSDPFPEFSCAYGFARHLQESGIPCTSVTATSPFHPTATFSGGRRTPVFGFESGGTGARLTCSGRFIPADSLTVITSTSSAELWKIVRETLRVSDNLRAETLLMALSRKTEEEGRYGSREDAVAAETRMLEDMGLDLSHIRIDDGSGLSRKNSVSPAFMVEFLTAMASSSCFHDFLSAMNTPGADERLLAGMPADVRSRIRTKSGYMGGVLCYCGYILPPAGQACRGSHGDPGGDEVTVFSIMMNGTTQPASELRAFIESVLSGFLQ